MTIRKKSPDTLKQQKESFFNYIKTKEKYSEAIADLFFDDEIEKIDDIDEVKHHLEEKWISKELVDSLEKDYTSYLEAQSFYWPIDDYSDELKESIKKNDKILHKIKRNILKEYKNEEDFISLNVENFVNDEFVPVDSSLFKDFWDRYHWNREVYKKWQEKKDLEFEIEKLQREINKMRYQLKDAHWFQMSKKKRIEKEIISMEQEKNKKEEKIKNIEKIVNEYENNEKFAKNIESIKNRRFTDILKIMWNNGEYTDINQYKQAIKNINKELEDYLVYIPEENITKIKTWIIEIITENQKKRIHLLKTKLESEFNEYFNYFYFWEDKKRHFVNLYSISNWFDVSIKWIIPTVYTKSRIDSQILNIISRLWWNLYKWEEILPDNPFMNDIFIHTTWFNVLDEILEEWWIVSTNEIWERSKRNIDISESKTQNTKPHKDIYFSRGYRKNGYWYHENNDDFVFIANTMANFANSGYWIPLNPEMQNNPWFDTGEYKHDIHWYSIISKSALEKNFRDDSYSKIDIKDLYIFVSESKKDKIESNPEYKIDEANIIYIPKKYNWEMTYQLYEFMKSEIEKREQQKQKGRLIPQRIITDRDGIKSISTWYQWAFCVPQKWTPELSFNPIKNWNKDNIIKFIEKFYDDFWLKEKDIDLLKKISIDMDEVDNISISLKYPKELILLIIFCMKMKLSLRNISSVSGKLEIFGYNSKELWIFYKSIERIYGICGIWNERYLYSNGKWREYWYEYIYNWCGDWWVDFNKMKEFLVIVSGLVLDDYKSKLVLSVFGWL